METRIGSQNRRRSQSCDNSCSSSSYLTDQRYTLLTHDDVYERMQKIISDAAEVLAINHLAVKQLLQHFKWDATALMEKYYDSENNTDWMHKLNIPNLQHQRQQEQQQQQQHIEKQSNQLEQQQQQQLDCMICYERFNSQQLFGTGCGHRFCSSCWCSYLTERMRSLGKYTELRCPAYKCNMLLDDKSIKSHVKDPSLLRLYRRSAVINFVSNQKQFTMCPGTDCDLISEQLLEDAEGAECCVTCRCGKTYCSLCGHDWHLPIKCEMLQAWLQRITSENMNSHWIVANTKECPKCSTTIEKNGGCNHMVCRNQQCRHEFCWVCMDEWSLHGTLYYKCNRFNEAGAEKVRKRQTKSRDYLLRYLHYYDFYMNHFKSLEMESKLADIVQQKMQQIQHIGHSWVETKFLSEAVEALCNCRRTLMYTYVFAYYLLPSNQQLIFEDNQRSLQLAIETLSEKLERELDMTQLQQLKQDVQDKYRFCLIRSDALVQHVMDGYHNNWWKFDYDQPFRLRIGADGSSSSDVADPNSTAAIKEESAV